MSSLLPFVLAGAQYLDPNPAHTHDLTIIATAIAEVVERERPLFADDESRFRTASLILAIGFREGSLRTSVLGDCSQSKPGEPCKGTPHSFCTMQINVSVGGSQALNDDPNKCIRTALSLLRTSMRVCKDHPIAWYAGGLSGCKNDRAQRISRDRISLAKRLHAAALEALKENT